MALELHDKDQGRTLRGFSAFAEGGSSIVKAEPGPAEARATALLDKPSQAIEQHLAQQRAALRAEVEAKLKEFDTTSDTLSRYRQQETRSFVEYYTRHSGFRRLREAIRKLLECSVPDDDAVLKKQVQRNNVWRVVGGADGRSLIVRSGPTPNWPKLSQKLDVGSWVEEKEVVMDRIRYELLVGTGPKTGWVSVMLRDEVLAVKVEKLPQSIKSKAEVSAAGRTGVKRPEGMEDSKAVAISFGALKQKEDDSKPRSAAEALFGELFAQKGSKAKAVEDVKPYPVNAEEKPLSQEEQALAVCDPKVVSAREACESGEAIPLPPRVCEREQIGVLGLIAAHVKDQDTLTRLYYVLESAWEQELTKKQTDFVLVLSWYAPPGELFQGMEDMLPKFRQKLKDKSWVDIQQSSPFSQFQHLRAALAAGEEELRWRWQIDPNGGGGFSKKSAWVVFGDDDDLWHRLRVDSYVRGMRSHRMLDGVGIFASLGRLNVDSSYRPQRRAMPTDALDVEELLRQQQLYRMDETVESKTAWKSICEADNSACQTDPSLDLPMEYFDYCPRLRIVREFFESVSEDLLAHRYCDLRFLKFMRSYPTHGRELGLEVFFFKPISWMYFYANPSSSDAFVKSMMSTPSIWLRSTFGSYLSVKPNRSVVSKATKEPGEAEEFVQIGNNDGTVSLLSSAGWYLSVGSDGYVYADSTAIGPAEMFEPIPMGTDTCPAGTAMISLWNVKYRAFLVVEKDGDVKAFHDDPEPPGRTFFAELSTRSHVIGHDNGHVTATVHLRTSELEFARQECELFTAHCPGLVPEKLARLFAVFRNSMELTLVERHRTVLDQPEFDELVFQQVHMVFESIFTRIATLPVSKRNTAARAIYEVCQRFSTVLASDLEVQVLWRKGGQLMVPSDKTMKVWTKYPHR